MPKNWREMAARVAAMKSDELRTRLRQEAAKWIDRITYGAGIDAAARELSSAAGARKPTRNAARMGDAALSSGRFYFETRDVLEILALLRERFPAECEAAIERANLILRHQFDVLGFQGLDYGSAIDWRLDPVSGKRAPNRPWYKIRFLQSDEVGDHKITWEINRHQQLVTLAIVHLLTGESRYLTELLDQWRAWRKQNPYPIGINWASSLEVAFRSLAWLWVGHLLASSPGAPKAFQHEIARALALSGRHIERYLSTYSSPNTHLLGEAVALFSIGTLCPRFRSAPRWQRLGWQIVLDASAKQVQADGMHFEQSVYYHVYALDFFLHTRILAARNGIAIPDAFDQTIERMLELLAGISQAGVAPRFGDDDGGRVFNPQRNRSEHLLDPLSTGAVVYNDSGLKAAAGSFKEETLWLLGPEGARRFDALDATPAPIASQAFRSSGLYVLAGEGPQLTQTDGTMEASAAGSQSHNTIEKNHYQLVIDAGPQGAGNSGHGHADALSLHLSANGSEWLIDPGTFRYVPSASGDGSGRNRFRGTAAHNTLLVDGLDQAEPLGPFIWGALPETEARLWATGEHFDLFCGNHRGYQRLASPVIHHRWVFGLKSEFWLVRDVAEGNGEHDLEISWHFSPGFTALYTPPGFTLMSIHSGAGWRGLALAPVEAHGWSQEVRRGQVSPAYGVEDPAPVVRFAARTQLPADFAVILQPVVIAPERLGKFTRSMGEDAVSYRYQTGNGLHLFFFSDSGRPWAIDGWKSDARFVYIGEEGKKLRMAFCSGTFLDATGQCILTCGRPVERCEISGSKVLCSDPQAVIDFKPERMRAAFEAMAGAL
ncbi:MAG TPA: alginate lyase family protein [Terriglobia bacterium]|nr:alginate lyase family protein [Terriglobia bacterium]